MGRPTLRTPYVEAEILRRISEGASLRTVCRDETMPSRALVNEWLAAGGPFVDQYARAVSERIEVLAEEVLEIPDDVASKDANAIAAARLRVDARKWFLSKVAPRKYGERSAVEVSGPNGAPVAQTVAHEFSDEHYAQLIRASQAAGFVANGALSGVVTPPALPVGGAAASGGDVAPVKPVGPA